MLKPFGKNRNCSLRFVILNLLSLGRLQDYVTHIERELDNILYYTDRTAADKMDSPVERSIKSANWMIDNIRRNI